MMAEALNAMEEAFESSSTIRKAALKAMKHGDPAKEFAYLMIGALETALWKPFPKPHELPYDKLVGEALPVTEEWLNSPVCKFFRKPTNPEEAQTMPNERETLDAAARRAKEKCPACDGRGTYLTKHGSGEMTVVSGGDCGACKGLGKVALPSTEPTKPAASLPTFTCGEEVELIPTATHGYVSGRVIITSMTLYDDGVVHCSWKSVSGDVKGVGPVANFRKVTKL